MPKASAGRGFGWLIAAALANLAVLSLPAPTQEPAPDAAEELTPDVLVPFRRAPVVDGELGDWAEYEPLIRLNRREQVWDESGRGAWGGEEDLSAEFYLAYDRSHLYLAGEVRDDSLIVPERNQSWHWGDALEVFLDLDLDDDLDGSGERTSGRFNADDLQIFLMPLSEGERPAWGVIDHSADPPQPSSLSFTGFQVAGTPQEGGYRFEVAIPLHNFPALQPDTHAIGFNFAIDDHDGDTDRYQYMTWTGSNPINPVQDTSKLGRLVFDGPGLLSEVPDPGLSISPNLLSDLPYLLVPLLCVGLLFVLVRLWNPLRRKLPWLRPALLGTGVLIFAAGLLLPRAWMGWREDRMESRLADVTATLKQQLPKMERGTLGSYRGAQRDEALMDLLRGDAIVRQPYWEHRPLVELVESGFGEEPWDFPGEGFQVRPYWIPLSAGKPEQFDFAEPLDGELLYVVVARPDPPLLALEEGPPALRIELQPPGNGATAVSQEHLLERPFEDADDFARNGWEVAYKVVSLEAPTTSVVVTAVNRDDLYLVGLTLEPTRGEERQPVFLGQATRGGVETDLRGSYPTAAGLELPPGAKRRLEIPEHRAEAFQKLWLIYCADYRGALITTATGAQVGRVTVSFQEEGVRPLVVDLEHQVSMLFELDRHNSVVELPEPVDLAFVWEDAARERHVNLVYEVDLPEGARVRSIEFDNRARYTVRYRSVVFGSPKPARPQDVGDSPLVSAGSGRRLRDEILQQTRGAAFAIYREGRLSQSTMSESVRQEHLVMPREAQQHLAADQTYGRRSLDRGQLFETYYPLSGDGWQGAELGVFLGDDGYGEAERLSAIWGAVLLLLSAPILLVLFSDSLSLLGNLRLRLIAVLSAATLVPLGILSVILVGVLEQGHEADLKQGMRQAVTNATAQLREQGRTLQESARSWLDSLVDNPQRIEEVDTLPEAMEGTLENQLPPDWGGGFLRLSFIPDAETPIRPFTRSAGQARLIGAETPLRPEPAIDVFWGEPILGVSVEREESEGRYTLSAGRSLNDDLLGTLASDRAVLLLGTRGYPLGAAAPASPSSDEQSPSAAELTSNARRPQVMRERMRILEQVLDQGQPVIRREAGWLVGYDVLRDAQETPRALLALVQPDQRAALELPVGRVPVRAFFMLAGGLVVLLSVFLSFLVTSRISRPIERLEQGARALSRGELDVQVEETEERGEIGRLTRTFNQMALELRGRMGDLRLLNRGIQDLSSSTLELSQTIASARSFCSRNSPAHQVRVALLERERNRVELHGELVEPLDLQAPDVRALLTASGPFSMPLGTAHKMGAPVLAEACSPYKSAVVLPMFLGGRAVGAFLLLFEGSEPSPVNLELLTTVATQAATAVVNAQLHRHAVRDPYTGAYIPEHFHRRVVQEVGRAQERGQSLALLGLRLRDRGRFEALGPEGFRRLLERMSTQLQEHLPDGGFMCHRGEGQFEVLLPGVESAVAQDMLETWLEDLGRIEGVVGAMARYPEDAVSAEFLFEALAEGFVTTGERARTDREAGPAHQAEGALPLSPGMREVYLTLRKVAPTDLTILLEGETGTGKEILTDTIHRWSRRASGPLVKVHCAALAESLLQSELFGHEKGAFTGATGRKIGKFELAQAGTIFLDEIGEISLEVQVQLLRVLQEREIDRVGGTAPVPVDVRVIAATNRNLVELVRDGRFREDLYYRLQGMVIRVPPLRERKREIPSLVEHFRREALETGHSRVEGFSADAMDELFRRDWPGNIRELRNACFRAMVLASGTRVEVTDLMGILTPEPPPLSAGDPETKPSPAEEPTVTLRPPPGSLRGRLRALHDLVRAEGNLSTQECAAKLGVSSRTSLRDLQELVARGYLERVGKRRGARYRLAQTPSA